MKRNRIIGIENKTNLIDYTPQTDFYGFFLNVKVQKYFKELASRG